MIASERSSTRVETPMSGTLITGGTIIDCTGAKPRKNAALFIESGRIAKLGTTEAVTAFAAKRGPHKTDRKSTRLNSSHIQKSRMPSSA